MADEVASKAIAALKASGMFPTLPAKPSVEGGVTPLQPVSPEEVVAIKIYAGAHGRKGPTPPDTSLLAQAKRDLAAAGQEAEAATKKQNAARQLLTKASALPSATSGGQGDLGGPGFHGGASSSGLFGLGGGLSGSAGAGPSSSSSPGRGCGPTGGGGTGLRDLGDEGTRLALAKAATNLHVVSTSVPPYVDFPSEAVCGPERGP